MIIDCICGLKKFEVEDDQIHHNGRQVKCGVCSKEWFYKPENILEEESQEENPEEDFEDVEEPSTQELLSDEIDLDEEVSIPQTGKERSDTAEKYLLKNKTDGDSKRKRFLIETQKKEQISSQVNQSLLPKSMNQIKSNRV